MMPGVSGDQMVTAIRAHAELDDIPIVLLTAKADDDLRVRLLREGRAGLSNEAICARRAARPRSTTWFPSSAPARCCSWNLRVGSRAWRDWRTR